MYINLFYFKFQLKKYKSNNFTYKQYKNKIEGDGIFDKLTNKDTI